MILNWIVAIAMIVGFAYIYMQDTDRPDGPIKKVATVILCGVSALIALLSDNLSGLF